MDGIYTQATSIINFYVCKLNSGQHWCIPHIDASYAEIDQSLYWQVHIECIRIFFRIECTRIFFEYYNDSGICIMSSVATLFALSFRSIGLFRSTFFPLLKHIIILYYYLLCIDSTVSKVINKRHQTCVRSSVCVLYVEMCMLNERAHKLQVLKRFHNMN